MKRILSMLLSICLLLPLIAACGQDAADSPTTNTTTTDPTPDGKIEAVNLMADVTANQVADREPDDAFKTAYADFAAKLLTGSAALEREENLLISPLSAMLALAMTANGAEDETLAEMQTLLGGTLSMEELNGMLRTWVASMATRKYVTLSAANSIWFKEKRFIPDPAFLQTNADYFGADVYAAPFSDQTVKDVNLWIEEKTNGLIKEMLNGLDPETVMLLINTLYFQAEWNDPYQDGQLEDGTFHGVNGDETVQMMRSVESTYLSMEGAQGFKKYYKGGFYFAALLPDEGTDIADFVASLTGEKLTAALSSGSRADVYAKLPAFSYDCDLSLKEVLAPHIPDAFTPFEADFSGMGTTDNGDPLFISKVLQKTNITLDKNGTTAAAATVVVMNGATGMPEELPVYHITLDRPFVYVITDSYTGLPIFIGVVEQL
ncbi:MAG: serpin family protein [Clostridia bacterium]|nr:serpin family protein [Clostridia bacterium]